MDRSIASSRRIGRWDRETRDVICLGYLQYCLLIAYSYVYYTKIENVGTKFRTPYYFIIFVGKVLIVLTGFKLVILLSIRVISTETPVR